jgi:hypothetical protein
LPGYVTEARRLRADIVWFLNGAKKVSDDLEVVPKEPQKERGFGTSIVDGPGSSGSAFARGQTNVALSSYAVA